MLDSSCRAIGKAFGIPFDIPLLPSIVLLVIYGFEINSCYGNYFEAHGRHVKVDIFKFSGGSLILLT